MTRFVELRNTNGSPCAVNPDNVCAVTPSQVAGRTDLILLCAVPGAGVVLTVKGEYASVLKSLERKDFTLKAIGATNDVPSGHG